MISCQEFFTILKEKGFTFFTGIPDSTFKHFIKFISDNNGELLQNIVASNECESIAISAGYYLATSKIGVVYMQNSGLGKTVNPLTSLCDPEIYAIPILLLIGWRGEPGKIDAPQHRKMGRIMLSLLDTLEIPYSILKPEIEDIRLNLNSAIKYFNKMKGPYAFIIKRNFFKDYKSNNKEIVSYELSRQQAIDLIMDNLNENNIVISTTGFTSREVYEYREKTKKAHNRSFYNIGSMGCASSIGLTIALHNSNKKIFIFDGDGAAIMQMGAFTTIGKNSPKNFIHIVFDNHMHETTGGQPTNSSSVDFVKLAFACNYKYGKVVITKNELIETISDIKNRDGPIIIVIKVKPSFNAELKRPEKEPKYYKEIFQNYLINSK